MKVSEKRVVSVPFAVPPDGFPKPRSGDRFLARGGNRGSHVDVKPGPRKGWNLNGVCNAGVAPTGACSKPSLAGENSMVGSTDITNAGTPKRLDKPPANVEAAPRGGRFAVPPSRVDGRSRRCQQSVRKTSRIAFVAMMLVNLPAVAQVNTDAESLETETARSGIPIGCRLIEGDIIMCGDSLDRGTYKTNQWTDGIVPYVFSTNVDTLNRQRSVAAMVEWEAVAAMDFAPWDPVQHGLNRIVIRDSTNDAEPSNSSQVGMAGGAQNLNMVSWHSKFTIVHELGHALGFWHEQSRLDRDGYVQIHWDRITDGHAHNFNLQVSGSHGPYDFDSLMHYSQCAFSCCSDDPAIGCSVPHCGADLDNCRTITVRPPYTGQWQYAIGQLDHLSFWDARVMSFLYPQADWLFVDETAGAAGNGTYFQPWRSLLVAYLIWAPEGSTIWILEPGDHTVGATLSRPMTIRSSNGLVALRP